MKRILLLALLFAPAAFGQTIGGSQINKKTNGGLVADSSDAVAVGVYRASSAPSSPVTGQLWCDTTTTPCSMKIYTGSAWTLEDNLSAMSTQTSIATFPGSPTDGQIFIDKSHNVAWYYNATTTLWCELLGGTACSSGNLQDTFNGATIANPTTAPSGAMAGSGGSMTAGTHQFCYTDVNSTGGETLCSSNSISFTAVLNDKFNATGILAGATGTTARRVYMSKAGATTPMYWVGTISDNTTTTFSVTAADASLVTDAPTVNFSGPMSSGAGIPSWTVTNTTSATTSGGCGTTGSALLIRASNALAPSLLAVATDPTVRCAFDITTYNSGNYIIQYRVVAAGKGFSSNAFVDPVIGTARVGSSDAGIRFSIDDNQTGPLGSSNWATILPNVRTTASGTSTGTTGMTNNGASAWPTATSFPYWIRFVKKGSFHQFFISSDGTNWIPSATSVSINSESGLAMTPSSAYTQFEFDAAMLATAADLYFEIDSLTLTVF